MWDWYESKPKSVTLLFALAFSLLSAFSGRLPSALQDIGLSLGLAITALAIIGFILHLVKYFRGNNMMEPIDLIIVGVGGVALFAAIAFAGLIWDFSSSKATTTVAPTAELNELRSEEPSTKTFYSQAAKERIVDALDDLGEILNKDGGAVKQTAIEFMAEWNHQRILVGQQKKPDTNLLIQKLSALEELSMGFNQKLYGDGELLNKYDKCSKELNGILAQHKDQRNTLSYLVDAKRKFASGIAVLETLSDQGSITEMMTEVLSVQEFNFAQAESDFIGWINQSKQRSAALRDSLQ